VIEIFLIHSEVRSDLLAMRGGGGGEGGERERGEEGEAVIGEVETVARVSPAPLREVKALAHGEEKLHSHQAFSLIPFI